LGDIARNLLASDVAHPSCSSLSCPTEERKENPMLMSTQIMCGIGMNGVAALADVIGLSRSVVDLAA
jgi:hypothetical protein